MNAERRAQLLGFLEQLGLELPTTPQATPDTSGSDGAEDPLAWLDEALTHTSAGLSRNHERLEFLGDAVLRLAASEFLQQQRPGLSVGQSSTLRAQLVSDRWLAELGEHCGIDAVLRIGAMAAGDLAGRATLQAEACEAVIGALYRIWGNLDPVLRWLTPHWQRSVAELAADPHRHNWKSALQEWSQGEGLGLPQYRSEERSQAHGDPKRFHCRVQLGARQLGEGWGRSRRMAEQDAAQAALQTLRLRAARES
jgi:ribonuclease III